MPSSWFVYLIETDAGLYCGISTDVERRYQQHASGKGAKYFRRAPPKRLAYIEPAADRAAASRREVEIKSMTRRQKLQLIANESCD